MMKPSSHDALAAPVLPAADGSWWSRLANPPLPRLGVAFFALCGLGLAVDLVLSLVDVGIRRDRVAISNDLYTGLIAAAALGAIWGAARCRGQRLGWALIAAGLVAWAIGELMWMLPGSAAVPEWAADALFLALYVFAILGVRVLTAPARSDRTLSLGLLAGLLALATVWSAIVFGDVADVLQGGADVAPELAYPLLDLALLATILIAWWSSGWANARAFGLLTAGVVLTGLGDGIYAGQLLEETYRQATPLDLLWPAGALLIAAAPWLASTRLPASSVHGLGLSLALGSVGVASAVALLVWDHYQRLPQSTIVLATLTLGVAGLQFMLLHHQRAGAVREARAAVLRSAEALALAVDLKHEHTSHHSDRVGELAAAIGAELGLSVERVARISVAARLHDVGKLVASPGLRRRVGDAVAESEQGRAHVMDGARMLETAGLRDEALWVRHQYERWDGSGYPEGLAGDAIPLESRIIAVANTVVARGASDSTNGTQDESVSGILAQAGTSFDPAVVAAASRVADPTAAAGPGSIPAPAETVARGADDASDAAVARRYGHAAGALFLAGSILALPSSFLVDSAPSTANYLVTLVGIASGLVCFLVPWERISERWFHLAGAAAVVEVAVGGAVFSPHYDIYFVFVAVFAAYIFRSRAALAVYLALITVAWLTQPLYSSATTSEALHFAAVGIPVMYLIAVTVLRVSERLEESRSASMKLAEEAVEVTLRIRGGKPAPGTGQTQRAEVSELARLLRYLRGHSSERQGSILRR